MSGRLIITTKKTYCPWNPANVERVLRDERLERERLERQQQNEEDESKRRRNKQEDTNDDEPPQQGHINLFPEAREAEIRLAHGGSSSSSNGGGDAEKQKSGILPLPLGGNESTNRKLGNVPFYMQTQSSSRQEDDKYVNSSHLGIRRNRMGVTTSSDEITNSIMRDQFASREEYRKQKNDPMSRFSVDSSDAAAAGNIYANRESSSRAEHYAFQNHVDATSSGGVNNSPHHEHGQSQSRKRKEHNKSGEDDCSKDSSSSSSSSLSSNSSVSRDRRRRNKSRRKHDSKQSKRSKHRHRSDYSPLHSKKKRHKDKKSKRKHHSNSKEPDDGDRRRKRHNNPSLLPYSASNMDLMECKMSDDQQLLDDMRRRRHDREAREMERQRQLMR